MDTSEGGYAVPSTQRSSLWPEWHEGEALTSLEDEMCANAEAGRQVDRGQGPFELDEMKAWGKERSVRASVLRHLLIKKQWSIDVRGIRLRGLRIVGRLDLEAATLRCPLLLDSCYFDADEPVCLDHATAELISLTECRLAGLTGELLIAKAFNLKGSTLSGPLLLRGADIDGYLSCHGVHLDGVDEYGDAFGADAIKADSIFLNEGFTAAGTIRLPGAEITRALACDGAHFIGVDEDGYALLADQIKVGDSIYLNKEFTAVGAIGLPGAVIGGSLICNNAHLDGRNQDGYSLDADDIRVGRNVLFNRFTTAGAIRMSGAHIAGVLESSRGSINGQDEQGYALLASGIEISGIYLDGGFEATGTIKLRSAHVRESVELAPKRLVGLDAAHAQIAGTLNWIPEEQAEGQVNLQGAVVGELDDDWSGRRINGYWPIHGQLRLDGFTYSRFGGVNRATPKQRLEWIRSQYQGSSAVFATQPYEQLAAVYRQSGLDAQARRAAIACRVDLRSYGKLSWHRWISNWLLDKSIKYGYQTWRAVVGLGLVYLAFLLISIAAERHNAIVPVGNIAGLHPVPVAGRCTTTYPCFYPAGYAIDVVIPIVNVHQADNWALTGGWGWVASTWIATGLGWALATLLVVGYTGIVRQD